MCTGELEKQLKGEHRFGMYSNLILCVMNMKQVQYEVRGLFMNMLSFS